MTKLLQQIDWWRKDGHFNFELYLAYCKAKIEHYEKAYKLFYTCNRRTKRRFKALFSASNGFYCIGWYCLPLV